MTKKDKFAQMRQSGEVASFNNIAESAATVAAIERQQEQHPVQPKAGPSGSSSTGETLRSGAPGAAPAVNPQEPPRFMRLPNPQIPLQEYNLVSSYCNSFANMTRMDFVELAIIEKLHNDGGMSQEDFDARYEEIRNRLPRGQRKGTRKVGNHPSHIFNSLIE